MAEFYEEHDVQVIMIVGQDNFQNPSTQAFAAQYEKDFNTGDPILTVNDPNFNAVRPAAAHWTGGNPVLPHFIVVDQEMKIHHSAGGLIQAANALEKITGVAFPFEE